MRFDISGRTYDLPDHTKSFHVEHSAIGQEEIAIEFFEPEDTPNPIGFRVGVVDLVGAEEDENGLV